MQSKITLRSMPKGHRSLGLLSDWWAFFDVHVPVVGRLKPGLNFSPPSIRVENSPFGLQIRHPDIGIKAFKKKKKRLQPMAFDIEIILG